MLQLLAARNSSKIIFFCSRKKIDEYVLNVPLSIFSKKPTC